jgi:transposase
VTADETYSAARLPEILRRERIVPVIPSRSDQPDDPDLDREIYRERNLVGRLVGKLKQFRRVATRHNKLDARYLAFVQLAAATVRRRDGGEMR